MIAIGFAGSVHFRLMIKMASFAFYPSSNPTLIGAFLGFSNELLKQMQAFGDMVWRDLKSGQMNKVHGPMGTAKEVVSFYTGYCGIILLCIATGDDP